MGVSKVMRSTGETIMDISGDTVTADSLLTGYTAHGADGNLIIGTAAMPYNVNLLDNADWGYALVNQRGETSYSLSDAYGVDRWRTTGTITITAPTASAVGYITMSSGCVMKQRIEILPSTLIGKTITAAVDIGGTVYSGSAEFPESGEETVFTGGSVTVAVGLDSGVYELCGVSNVTACPYIKATASAAVNVRRVWLEIGSVCHMETMPPRSYAVNLAVCQRYFQRWGLDHGNRIVSGYFSSSNSKFYFPAPYGMRVDMPSVSATGKILVRTVNGYSIAPGFTSSDGGDVSLLSSITVSGLGCELFFGDGVKAVNTNNTTGNVAIYGYFDFSAEL